MQTQIERTMANMFIFLCLVIMLLIGVIAWLGLTFTNRLQSQETFNQQTIQLFEKQQIRQQVQDQFNNATLQFEGKTTTKLEEIFTWINQKHSK